MVQLRQATARLRLFLAEIKSREEQFGKHDPAVPHPA